MTQGPTNETAQQDISRISAKYGLTPAELGALLRETDQSRGLLTPSDLHAGLSSIVAVYVQVLASTAERVADPAERIIVDRFLSQAMESLHAQLEGAGFSRN